MASSTKQRPVGAQAHSAMREAVVILSMEGTAVPPTPSETRRMANAALTAASSQTGLHPAVTNIMDQLHSFSVQAPQAYINALANAPQVDRILPNEASESAFIKPVRKRSVELPD